MLRMDTFISMMALCVPPSSDLFFRKVVEFFLVFQIISRLGTEFTLFAVVIPSYQKEGYSRTTTLHS